jgi:hypothetical protein
MKKLSFAAILFFVLGMSNLFGQGTEQQEVLTNINLKSYYFQHLVGDVKVNDEGILLLNGVKIDLKNTEVGYQSSEEGDYFIYFVSANNEKVFEAWNDNKLLFKTNNVLHLIRSKEQAVELVVLFNLLKSFYEV